MRDKLARDWGSQPRNPTNTGKLGASVGSNECTQGRFISANESKMNRKKKTVLANAEGVACSFACLLVCLLAFFFF